MKLRFIPLFSCVCTYHPSRFYVHLSTKYVIKSYPSREPVDKVQRSVVQTSGIAPQSRPPSSGKAFWRKRASATATFGRNPSNSSFFSHFRLTSNSFVLKQPFPTIFPSRSSKQIASSKQHSLGTLHQSSTGTISHVSINVELMIEKF